MPGVIDADTGDIIVVDAYKDMSGVNLFAFMKEVVDVPVSVENDAKAAILAEAWKGALENISTAACVILGSGIGGGIIMDHKLQKGSRFAAGEISNMMVTPGVYRHENIIAYDSGMSGFLKTVAKARNMDPEQFEIAGNASDKEKRISGKEVFEWIEAGQKETVKAYEEWLQRLGWLLFNLKMVLDPEVIVIGGGVSRNARFIRDLKQEYEKIASVLAANMPKTEITVCQFESDANLIGAVYNWKLHQR